MNNTTIFYTSNCTNYLIISRGGYLTRPHNYLFSLIHNLLNCLNFACNFVFQGRKNLFFPQFSYKNLPLFQFRNSKQEIFSVKNIELIFNFFRTDQGTMGYNGTKK
jgi:hypothetical protein